MYPFLCIIAYVVIITSPLQAQTFVDWPQPLLNKVFEGFSQPTHITHANDGSNRIFVVEQTGTVRIIKNAMVLNTPFLDIRNRLINGGERGLLSMAFPPDYDSKQYFYVNYTNLSGHTVIARYHVTTDPDVADPGSEEIILTVNQPFENHNGGQIAFGPMDGYLYIGMGDGGSSGDPENNGQETNTLLGKILRIDVESGVMPYGIPSDNPFLNDGAFRDEIWALGLRNPWRFSFDQQNGDLYIGDVGQNTFEEINFQSASSAGGENYGWRLLEGFEPFKTESNATTNLTAPVTVYGHDEGCSVTGGLVCRGSQFSRMHGVYFYGDFCSGRIWGLVQINGVWHTQELLDSNLSISTFGEDETGNLYVADLNTGDIYTITDVNPGLSINIQALPYPAVIGRPLMYMITLTNSTSDVIAGLTLNAVMPDHTTFVSETTSQGNSETPPVGENGTITSAFNTVNAGMSATLSFIVNVEGMPPDTTQSFTMTVTSASDEQDIEERMVSLMTQAHVQGDLSRSNHVDVTDIFELIPFILKQRPVPEMSTFEFIVSDMDANQQLNIIDLVRMVRVIIGMPGTTLGVARDERKGLSP